MYGRFIFHPVGQGLFYTGSITGNDRLYNFVYDCGSENKRFLTKSINNHIAFLCNHNAAMANEKPMIDFAVISHFDVDHVIGIYELKQKAVIRQIYLPYIDKVGSPLFEATFDYLIYNAEEEKASILSGAINWLRSLYMSYENMRDDNNRQIESSIHDERSRPIVVKDDKDVIINNSKGTEIWRFHVFNKEVDNKKISKFEVAVEHEFGKDAVASDLLADILKRGKLNEIYKKAFGSSNITSLILVHYPLIKHAYTNFYNQNNRCQQCDLLPVLGHKECRISCQRPELSNHYWYHRNTAAFVTVLTGDAELNTTLIKKIKEILNNQPLHNRLLQVPHHGSNKANTKNWDNLADLKLEFDFYIVPFGYRNKHSLPDESVIRELQEEFKDFAYATQREPFEYEIYFEI